MKIAEYIMRFAFKQNGPFRRRDMMRYLRAQGISEKSADMALRRLCAKDRLDKPAYGLYAISEGSHREFIYSPSRKEVTLSQRIERAFPFVKFCLWNPLALAPYMRHVPSWNVTLVDVEKDAVEAVFFFLQKILPRRTILLNPTVRECERYIISSDMLIVRTLIHEAPVASTDWHVPTLEKMLVDAVSDKELVFAQGAELYTIYSNVFESNHVNKSRLLRYASRRNRKDRVMEIIKALDV